MRARKPVAVKSSLSSVPRDLHSEIKDVRNLVFLTLVLSLAMFAFMTGVLIRFLAKCLASSEQAGLVFVIV